LQNDKEAFEDAIDHCKEIISLATLERPMMPKSIADNFKQKEVTLTTGYEKKSSSFWTNNKAKDIIPSKSVHKNSYQLLGYCIRTGKKIPLNHERPFSDEAYESWAQWGDENYEENYDHFTGEKTHGETCKAKPILNKNWKKYQKTITE